MRRLILILMCMIVTGAYSPALAADYVGSDACFKCHPDQYNDFRVSGHPYKIQKAETAKFWQLPLPKGYTWDDISYVIGGAHKKSRYMDKKGYIITMTGPNRDIPGKNQYNIETGTWSDYEPGKKNLQYKCGPCHMTNYKAEGHQDGLEGIVGTWTFPGIQCEECHGPGGDHAKSGDKTKIKVDTSSAACGKCHIRGDKEKIPAGNGFIQHHEQYNEQLAGPHKDLSCVSCHNPHKKARFSIKTACESCHSKQAADYKGSAMQAVGVTCADCHMPKVTKSATNKGKYEGDVKTHIFKINIDPKAEMFFDEEVKGKKATFARGFVTLDFACLNCHKNKDMNWAGAKAKGIHRYGKM